MNLSPSAPAATAHVLSALAATAECPTGDLCLLGAPLPGGTFTRRSGWRRSRTRARAESSSRSWTTATGCRMLTMLIPTLRPVIQYSRRSGHLNGIIPAPGHARSPPPVDKRVSTAVPVLTRMVRANPPHLLQSHVPVGRETRASPTCRPGQGWDMADSGMRDGSFTTLEELLWFPVVRTVAMLSMRPKLPTGPPSGRSCCVA